MVLRRIGLSRVEREPLGAIVGNCQVRETGNRGIDWSKKRPNCLEATVCGINDGILAPATDLRHTKSEVSTPRRWMTNLVRAPGPLYLPRGLPPY